MDLNIFAQDFFETILDDLNLHGTTAEEAFVERFCGYLSDNGVAANVLPSFWQKSILGIKVNAYSWDPDEGRLGLFVADVDLKAAKLTTIGRTDARAALRRAVKFFQYARDGKLDDYLEESSVDAYDLAALIERRGSKIQYLDVYLLTNSVYKSNDLVELEVDGVRETTCQVWDIERLFQLVNEMQGIDTLTVNCAADLGETFEVLLVPGTPANEQCDCYVGCIPGALLAKAYKKFGQRLIERNVRSFLQARGKVNKGIRDTLRTQRELFVAYNNGISTTAEAVKLTPLQTGSRTYRVDLLTGWQIVNGGQTTASLYHAWEEGTDLSGVYVQLKLTVLKSQDADANGHLITKISEYANTQNKISFSDLGANQSIHVELEKVSRTVWAPDPLGRKSEKKWYYERARGQYLVDLNRQPTPAAKLKFKAQNTKDQVITKTQFAKYYMAWEQFPHLVGRGTEDNYQEFMRLMERESPNFDAEFFKAGIARAIIFNTCDRVVKKMNLAGYKANVVAYTVALLSYVLGKQAPLTEVWNRQAVPDNLVRFMNELAGVVWTYLTDPARAGVNTSQWCKRLDCWNELRARSEAALERMRKAQASAPAAAERSALAAKALVQKTTKSAPAKPASKTAAKAAAGRAAVQRTAIPAASGSRRTLPIAMQLLARLMEQNLDRKSVV